MRPGPFVLCACALVAVSAAAWAQVPAGPVFQVNAYTTGRQVNPRLGMRAGGDFVVVWDHSPNYPNTLADVHARRFTAAGVASGAEFRVNAFTTATQSVAGGGIARDASGNAVVAWTDFRTEGDVFARRVSAAGVPLGNDLMANPGEPGIQSPGRVAAAPDGRFVVVWDDLVAYDVFGRRFDAAGNALGAEFRVNTYTTYAQRVGGVAIDGAGNFTVVWYGYGQDAPVQAGIFGQRFDASGQRVGAEFQVNTYTTGTQRKPTLAMRRDGSAVVAWEGRGPGAVQFDIWARLYSGAGAPQGIEFRVSAVRVGDVAGEAAVATDEPGNFVVSWGEYTPLPFPAVKARRFAAGGAPRGDEFQVVAPASSPTFPVLASDAVGNFTVAWHDASPADREVFAQRFGGLLPAGMTLNDGGNGVLEVPDDFGLVTSWRNLSGAAQTFRGVSSGAVVPPGLFLTLSPNADYGTVASGATGSCSGLCFAGALTGTRPSGHVDVTFVETLQPDAQGQAQRWVLHVGETFSDVPRASSFYRFVETVLHRGVTGGCGPTAYCPASVTSREQMSVFVLVAKEGPSYAPPACGAPVFNDVPSSSPFCRWIEELARRGVAGGCGGGSFCPASAVTREQMAVFVLRTLDPLLDPPACGTPVFADVPASSPFCRWIEELARRGVVSGCGGGNYCPAAAVTREQMAVFMTATFGLTLYGA